MTKPDLDPTLRSPQDELRVVTEHLNGRLAGKDVISVKPFDRETIARLFFYADEMRRAVETRGGLDLMNGERRIAALVFYEPSTRTFSSFAAAMGRVGGETVGIHGMKQYSSVSKGEDLRDTIKTLDQYADVIVLRHPEEGAAQIAADVAEVPVINAGDGIGEHPTQALLDLYTIGEEIRRAGRNGIDGVHVVFVGDLRYGRTVHSLVKLLSMYNVGMSFVSPENLRLKVPVMNKYVRDKGILVEETYDIHDVVDKADVLYVTRVQKERMSEEDYKLAAVNGKYHITPEVLEQARPQTIVMHPLPRNDEISREVDTDPRTAYFRQVKNGMYIRMALLAGVLGKAQ